MLPQGRGGLSPSRRVLHACFPMNLALFIGVVLAPVHCDAGGGEPSSDAIPASSLDWLRPSGQLHYDNRMDPANFLDYLTSRRDESGFGRARFLLEGDTCQSVAGSGKKATQCSEAAVKHAQTFPSETTWCCEEPHPKCLPNICGPTACQSITDLSCFCDDDLLEHFDYGYVACDASSQGNIKDALYPLEVKNMQESCCTRLVHKAADFKQRNQIGSYAPEKKMSGLQALESELKVLGAQICENTYPGDAKRKVCTAAASWVKDGGKLANFSETLISDAVWCCKEEEVCASCNSLGSFGCLPAGTIACECWIIDGSFDTRDTEEGAVALSVPDMCSKAEVETYGAESCCAKKNNLNKWSYEQHFESLISESGRRAIAASTLKDNQCVSIQPDGMPGLGHDVNLCVDRDSKSGKKTWGWCCTSPQTCGPTMCVDKNENGEEKTAGWCMEPPMEVGQTFCSCSIGVCKGRNCCLLAQYGTVYGILIQLSWFFLAIYGRRIRPLLLTPRRETNGSFDVVSYRLNALMTVVLSLFGPISWHLLFYPASEESVIDGYVFSWVGACLLMALIAVDAVVYRDLVFPSSAAASPVNILMRSFTNIFNKLCPQNLQAEAIGHLPLSRRGDSDVTRQRHQRGHGQQRASRESGGGEEEDDALLIEEGDVEMTTVAAAATVVEEQARDPIIEESETQRPRPSSRC